MFKNRSNIWRPCHFMTILILFLLIKTSKSFLSHFDLSIPYDHRYSLRNEYQELSRRNHNFRTSKRIGLLLDVNEKKNTLLHREHIINRQLSVLNDKLAKDMDENYDNSLSISLPYLFLTTVETVFWWYLAPGIDPDSRWFAPQDGVLLSKLLDPSIVLSPPPGSGLGFSSLLLNSFLILPAVWSVILLQEKKQSLPPLPFCLAGFLVGGGSLIPYMIIRKRRESVDYEQFSTILKFFEPSISTKGEKTPSTPHITSDNARNRAIPSSFFVNGQTLLIGLTLIIIASFAEPFLTGSVEFGSEFLSFKERIGSSQFTSLALFDFTMISAAIIDPMIDDAKRRNFLCQDITLGMAVRQMLPFLFPLLGPVAWIYARPRLSSSTR